MREHGRPQARRAAGGGHARGPRVGHRRRDRHRRRPAQPRTAARLPARPRLRPADPLGEVGPRQAHGGDGAVRRLRCDGLYLQVHTIDTGVEIGYRAETTFAAGRRGTRPSSSAASGSAERTVHHCAPGETLRMDKLVAICTSRDPGEAGPLDERCRAVLAAHRGRVRRDRRRQPRGLGAPVGGLRLRGRRRRAVHPRAAVRRLPPADHREPRRPDGQHRRQVAVRRGLPRARLLGHRDLHAPVLHPHPARHREGAAALPPPHPRRRARELPRVRHRRRPVRLGVGRHRARGVPAVHRRRRQPVLDARGGDPRLRRRRLRDLPVRRGHRRHRLPARVRRRGAVRDQPLLGRPGRRTTADGRLRAEAGHGARRVPLAHRQQRLHQPARPVAPALRRRRCTTSCATARRAGRRRRRDRAEARGARPLARRSPTASSGPGSSTA